jgi:organic hydroperoxide reductase OsmC/OhrA
MMGTLAGVLAAKQIQTPAESYWADARGDIENVQGILKITRIKVAYHLTIPKEKSDDARQAFSIYLTRCPAAQSVIGCIDIQHELFIEHTN